MKDKPIPKGCKDYRKMFFRELQNPEGREEIIPPKYFFYRLLHF